MSHTFGNDVDRRADHDFEISTRSIAATGNRRQEFDWKVTSYADCIVFELVTPNIIAINGVVSCADADVTNGVFLDNDEIFSTLNLRL